MVEMKSEPYTITFGIIGAGRIGKLHADNLLSHVKGAKLKTVTDPFLDDEWTASRNIPVTGKDHRIMLDDPEIDAILIGSPSPEHAAQMIECAGQESIFSAKNQLRLIRTLSGTLWPKSKNPVSNSR